MNYPNLFKPIKINQLHLKNRVIAAPGPLGDDEIYSDAAIIAIGSTTVDQQRGGILPSTKGLEKAGRLALCAEIAKFKRGGSKVAVELIHCGMFARFNTEVPIGPSLYTRDFDGVEVQVMDEDMMEDVIDKYKTAACMAKEIGADLILLHFGHGWLPAQFLSLHYNHRIDEYGGDYENRSKFPKKIVKEVRKAVGRDYPIYMRISGDEHVEDGIDFADVKRFLREIENQIDLVEISCGLDTEDEPKVHMCTTIFEPRLKNVHLAKEVKKTLAIPVSVVGAVMTPEDAERIIADGSVDMVSLRRSFIADPFWLRKAFEGRSDEIVPCLRCHSCYPTATLRKRRMGCAVNLRYCAEDFYPLEIMPSLNKKKVVVVGGGPGGMMAAKVASLRGHQVTLLEKSSTLGGNIKFSDYDKTKIDLKRYKDYLIRQLLKTAVEVRLDTFATKELVSNLNPDVLIIAVGAEAIIPKVVGIDKQIVKIGSDIHANMCDLGDNVVIIGAGTIGCEIGLELSEMNKNVTIIESSNEIAATGNHFYRVAISEKINQRPSLTICRKTECIEILDHGVCVKDENNDTRQINATDVVIAVGLKPLVETVENLQGICYETYVIGDAYKARKVENAIEEGYNIAYGI